MIPYVPRWPLFVFIVCATYQMGASAFFHTYFCMNIKAGELLKYDLAGISFMIMGSCTPPYYYGFSCDESWWYGRFYIAQVYACCLMALVATLFKDSCGKLPQNFRRKFQLASFLFAGWSTVPGCLHMTYYSTED